jgi:outer membrane protein
VTSICCLVGILLAGPPVGRALLPAQSGLLSVQEPPIPPPLPVDPTLPPEGLFDPGEAGVGPAPGARTLSLSRAVELALERNTGILNSADSVMGARFREDATRAQFHPQVTPRYQHAPEDQSFSLDISQKLPWTGGSVTASGTLTSMPGLAAPFGRSSDVHLILSQPVLRGFGPNATFFDLTNSRRAREGQERNAELTRQRVAVDVTSAFYQVVKERQLLSVARQSLKRSEGLKEASEARMKVGLASKLDVFRAALQAEQAQEAMVAAETGLETGKEQFRILLGLGPDEAIEPEAVVLREELTSEEPPLGDLIARALAKRLELQEGRDQVRDGERAAALARQNLLPQLDLNLDVSQLGYGATIGDTFRQADRRVSLYVSTSYPLERASERANAAIAGLDVDARKRAQDELQRQIEAEVRSALRNLARIRTSVELQRKGVDFATQQRRLATLRYQRGLASNFDVVDAEANLIAARTSLVGLLTDYQVARVQLLKTTGELDVRGQFSP